MKRWPRGCDWLICDECDVAVAVADARDVGVPPSPRASTHPDKAHAGEQDLRCPNCNHRLRPVEEPDLAKCEQGRYLVETIPGMTPE